MPKDLLDIAAGPTVEGPTHKDRIPGGFEVVQTSQDFDWAAADNLVICQEQPKTVIYENPAGQLVIRQQNWPDDDAYVFFNLEHLPKLIAELQAIVELEGITTSPGSDKTAAARQKRYRERHRNGG